MPSADPSNISDIIKIVTELKPMSILDVGIGVGKYGLLFRDYLDGHWAGHAFHDKNTWTLNLVGIEVFPKYITPVQEYVYSTIWIGEAYEILTRVKDLHCFDLVFLGDVLEHFEKDQGKLLIRTIRDNWLSEKGHILISTPNFKTMINDNRRIIFGNVHELHKCRWYPIEFKDFNMTVKVIEGKLLTVLLS